MEHTYEPSQGMHFLPEVAGIRTQPAPVYEPVRASGTASGPSVTIVEPASSRCGGDLPSCKVMWCENKGKITGKNRYSSASGKWQIVDGTWGGYGGYAHAQDAPESVQDARARQLWAESHGHWRQCL